MSFLSDTFTGSVEALSAHEADSPATEWDLVAGGDDLSLNGSGALVGVTSTSGECAYLHPVTPPSADYIIRMNVTRATGSNTLAFALLARANYDSSPIYTGYVARYTPDNSTLYLFAVKPGIGPAAVGYIQLGTYSYTFTQDVSTELALKVDGNVISVLINDVAVITETDNNIVNAGKVGIQWYSNSGSNFTFTAIESSEVDNSLADRMTAVEGEVDELQTDVAAAETAITTLSGQEQSFGVVTYSAAHTLAATDLFKHARFTTAGVPFTFPPDSTYSAPIGSFGSIKNAAGSGNITLTAGSGVTLNSEAGKTLVLAAGNEATWRKVAANTFDISGNLN